MFSAVNAKIGKDEFPLLSLEVQKANPQQRGLTPKVSRVSCKVLSRLSAEETLHPNIKLSQERIYDNENPYKKDHQFPPPLLNRIANFALRVFQRKEEELTFYLDGDVNSIKMNVHVAQGGDVVRVVLGRRYFQDSKEEKPALIPARQVTLITMYRLAPETVFKEKINTGGLPEF